MRGSNDLGCMRELIWYMELRTKAQMKGIDVLVEVTDTPDITHKLNAVGNTKWNYAIVKHIGNMTFSINEDCEMFFDYYHDGMYRPGMISYSYSLYEAERIVEKYNGNIVNMPKFYGFIRQYEGEPHNILDYQVMALNHFAEKYGIKYEEIFGCKGGYAEPQEEGSCIEDTFNIPGIDNMYHSCEKFFSEMAKNDGFLCIADRSRLDGEYIVWNQDWDIIEVDSVPYNHDNIMEYQEYKPEGKNECIPENTPEQEHYIPEYGHNSIPGDIPECILEQEYDTGNNAPF